MNPRWEAVVKGSAAAALVAYVVGLLAVAIYLEKLDVPLPDLAALKPRFAYTGIVVLAPLAFMALPVAAATADCKQGRRPSLPGLVALVAWEMLLLCALLLVLSRDQPTPVTGTTLGVAAQLVGIALAVGLLGAFIVVAVEAKRDRGILVAGCLLGAVVLIALFVVVFSREVLPRIPNQFGGLQPVRARLLFVDDAIADAREIGVGFASRGGLAASVSVLYEGDQYYVLRLGDGRIVQIAQDRVVGSITDSTQPVPRRLYTRDYGGHVGIPEASDQMVLVFSEPVDPASVVAGWNGRPLPVALRVTPTNDERVASLTVVGRTNASANLGQIKLRVEGQVRRSVRRIGATLQMLGTRAVVTVVRLADRASLTGRVEAWTASKAATDLSGNQVIPRTTHSVGDPTGGPESGEGF